jgi:hypothetical protein
MHCRTCIRRDYSASDSEQNRLQQHTKMRQCTACSRKRRVCIPHSIQITPGDEDKRKNAVGPLFDWLPELGAVLRCVNARHNSAQSATSVFRQSDSKLNICVLTSKPGAVRVKRCPRPHQQTEAGAGTAHALRPWHRAATRDTGGTGVWYTPADQGMYQMCTAIVWVLEPADDDAACSSTPAGGRRCGITRAR